MNIKSCFKGLLVLMIVSFAYSADTTAKAISQPAVIVSAVKSDAAFNGLKKQTVVKPTTTWSKIKGLFE